MIGDNTDIDNDNDGLLDKEEEIYGAYPLNPDTDGDGINDGTEIAMGTDPLHPDTDDDGIFFDESEEPFLTFEGPSLIEELVDPFPTDGSRG